MKRQNRRNLYRILQVQPDAPVEIIKASYRTLMQKLKAHPDLGGDEWDAAVINEAYAVLSDTDKRAAYDQTLSDLHRQIGAGARAAERWSRPAPPAEPNPQPATPSVADIPARPNTGTPCPFCGAGNPRGGYRQLDHCGQCHAPLKPVTSPTGRAGRAAERIEHLDDMQFVLNWPPTARYQARVLDLSPTGMQFVALTRLEVQQKLKIESSTLTAVAEVSRCQPADAPQTYQTGVRFLTLDLQRPSGTFFSANA